jgi:nicotinate-nucleotide pyrophosphorylase (carboxylating)
MIKDNHIKAVGSITEAIKKAKKITSHTSRIEVEVSSLHQFLEASEADADIIMLDNMNLRTMKEIVRLNKRKCILEASGNINENNIAAVAKTGVDIISVGSLTHSVKSLDISLNIR